MLYPVYVAYTHTHIYIYICVCVCVCVCECVCVCLWRELFNALYINIYMQYTYTFISYFIKTRGSFIRKYSS